MPILVVALYRLDVGFLLCNDIGNWFHQAKHLQAFHPPKHWAM